MNIKLILLVALLLLLLGSALAYRLKTKRLVVPIGAQAGELSLSECTYRTKLATYAADCGTLVVPENRSQPESRLLALPVKRIRSASPTPAAPIFYLTGGPGMSNMQFQPPDWLLAQQDVVLVGYRGVDGSVTLACPEFEQALLGVDGDVLSDASLAQIARAAGLCSSRLQAEGVDLAGYTLVEVVADLEAARMALGYPRINLLSESYGTRLAQIYEYLHPAQLQRVVMIGVNPPGRFVWEPAMIDAQLEYLSRLAARDAAFSARTPDLAATMRTVVQQMPRRWLFLPIDAGKVKSVAFVLLFQRSTAALVLDAFVAAERGDPSGLALLSLAYDLVVPKTFVWGDSLAKGGSADYDPGRDYATELRDPTSTLGSPVATLLWVAVAHGWPHHRLPAEFQQLHPSDVETLLVSGSMDFSTPAAYATQELLPTLTQGKQVILAEFGHVSDVWRVQPAATERLLSTFYATGTVDDSLYAYTPMQFTVRFGLPAMAKVLLGTGLLLVVAVGLGVKRLLQRRSPASPITQGMAQRFAQRLPVKSF